MMIDGARRVWLRHGIATALAGLLLPERVLGQAGGPNSHDARPYVADAPARLAWVQQRLRELPPRRRWLLLGEQHDADAHQWLQAAVVQALSEQGRLGALVLEMAERGHDTAALPRHADEEAVRAALAWHDTGWPWRRYGPVVMAAVRAGVVVAGGNLPRREHSRVMAENAWDATLSDPHQRTALLRTLDEGHCGLLPAAQLPVMARIQLARDDAMATTLLQQPHTDALVLLVTGAQHARRDRGVPHHLQRRLGPAAAELVHAVELRATDAPQPEPDPAFDALWLTPAVAPRDPCAGLRSRR